MMRSRFPVFCLGAVLSVSMMLAGAWVRPKPAWVYPAPADSGCLHCMTRGELIAMRQRDAVTSAAQAEPSSATGALAKRRVSARM